MSIISIRKVQMVSQSILGIDAEVGFFHNEPEDGSRYVELKAIINGKFIEEKIPIHDLISPGEIALLEWPQRDRLKINLAKWGISKFNKDEVFDLTAVAYGSANGRSQESAMRVRIPLPIIILHGYILREWWEEDSYWKPYYSLQEFLKYNGYDDSVSGYRTMWGQPDIRFSPRDASPADIVEQLDCWITNALSNTYANSVNIIGVSLGGLVGRYYITEYNYSNVYKLIMVTTINQGSSLFEGEFFIKLTSSRAEAQALLLNSEGEENLSNWLFPTYQTLYTPDGKEIEHPFRNLFHENGFDKPAPEGVHYYSIFSGQRESPYKLTIEEDGDWYRFIGDKMRGKGDGNSIVQAYKTFGHNILVPTGTHHAFMLGDSIAQSSILNVLNCIPEEYWS